jgi:hypothetical protein
MKLSQQIERTNQGGMVIEKKRLEGKNSKSTRSALFEREKSLMQQLLSRISELKREQRYVLSSQE